MSSSGVEFARFHCGDGVMSPPVVDPVHVEVASTVFCTMISRFKSSRCVMNSVASRSASSGTSEFARICGSTSLWNAYTGA